MKTVKVTYTNGDTITTGINGTDAEILEYFKRGRVFNIGNGEDDNMQAVVRCEFVQESMAV